MVNASTVREHLANFLVGETSLQEFEEWFVPATWDAHKSGDPEAEGLADEIEMNLSEYTDGVLSSEELRGIFASIAFPYVANRTDDSADSAFLLTPASNAECHIDSAVVISDPDPAPNPLNFVVAA